jgi:hypothetical protein
MLFRCTCCKHAKSLGISDPGAIIQCQRCGGDMVPLTLRQLLDEAKVHKGANDGDVLQLGVRGASD